MSQADSIPEFRGVPGFPHHRVSGRGRVQSSNVSKDGATWRDLKPRLDRGGYLFVSLARDGKLHYRKVHRLVLEAFVGPPADGMVCRHLDGNPRNNDLANLRWGTPKENGEDATRHARRRHGGHAAFLSDGDFAAILKLHAEGEALADLAERFGVGAVGLRKAIRARKRPDEGPAIRSPIPKALRKWAKGLVRFVGENEPNSVVLLREAATEIERLESEIESLRRILDSHPRTQGAKPRGQQPILR